MCSNRLTDMEETEVLLIEPFYGGSHKQLMDLLATLPKTKLITIPAKKWHWRARTAALYLSEIIPEITSLKTLFVSSVLNLCELIALRPDLSRSRKVIYFHENQLIYPVQKYKDRDFQYGYNQILSCSVADVVLFNSRFNMDSFLSSINIFLNAIPDHRPENVVERIRPKCQVLYFPINFSVDEVENSNGVPREINENSSTESIVRSTDNPEQWNGPKNVLHIIWPHRWEHDKNPDLFFRTLMKLKSEHCQFKVSVVGEQYSVVPDIFQQARHELSEHIITWGYRSSKREYYNILHDSDVVVSTADHEFYGVAMLEAVHQGCTPLCPNRLVYPEIYPKQFLYNTEQQLYRQLKHFCELKELGKFQRGSAMELDKFSWNTLKREYEKVLYSQAGN